MKIHLLQNVNIRSAMGSNLAPTGLINCTFELGELSLIVILLCVEILLDPLYWEEIFPSKITFL